MSPFKLILLALLSAQTLVVGAEPSNSGETQAIANPSAPVAEGAKPNALTALELQGRQLYLEGKMANGNPLVGKRPGNITMRGKDAACVQCHRRSGLGGVEGNEAIPPISGQALFGGGNPVIVQVDKLFNKGLSTPPKPYDIKSFSSAIRLGQHVSGRNLSALMPRYDLSDDQLNAVSAYLRTLSAKWSPGAEAKEIHLATVIAPGVSPERRKAFVDTLNAMLNQHNVNVAAGGKHRIAPIEKRMNSRRTWELEVWDLTGPSSTWAAQLEQKQRQNPAFAILSGLANDEWQPVQDFCELNKVACWFPSVDLVPEGADKGEYSLYFSAGVQLEAEVVTKQLLSAPKKPAKVVQLVGANPIARGAAASARKLLTKTGIEVQEFEWNSSSNEALRDALKSLKPQDALLCWLNSDELKSVETTVSAPSSQIFLSSTLAGESVPEWPIEWREKAWLVQRLEMPKMRAANLSRFNDWIKFRQLPLVDEKMQSEAYFAVNSFAWMVSSMLNNLYTDYLIDRAEATLSMREAMQVQEEVQSMMMGGGGHGPQTGHNPAEAKPAEHHTVDISFLMKREGTSAYPRLGLGVGQRFASKGAYIRKLNVGEKSSSNDAKWIVP